jgi:signal transduction histidine kinase
VGIPLAVRGRTLGSLTWPTPRPAAAAGGRVQLVAAFADQAAVALDHAGLQGRLQRLAVLEDRERIAKELHDGAIQACSRSAWASKPPPCSPPRRGAVPEIDDDGHGFDPATVTGTGQGLGSLRERAKGLGGTAEIHSTPGQGAQVRITIPH